MAVTYTTAAKVGQLLNLTFSGSTTPTTTIVESIINRKEDFIDFYTGHAWRTVTVGNQSSELYEHHDITNAVYYNRLGYKIKLAHRKIKTLNAGSGDRIFVFDGSSWVDWVASSSFTEGRENDYYLDYDRGFLYIKHRTLRRHSDIRLIYRYGEASVPLDIEEAATKLAAADIVMADQYFSNFPEGSSGVPMKDLANQWKADAMEILRRRKEIQVVAD